MFVRIPALKFIPKTHCKHYFTLFLMFDTILTLKLILNEFI